eukprot:s594_g15.t1
MPEGASRERTSTHPRDGRIPASGDPTSRMRSEGRDDGAPGDSDVVPAIADGDDPRCPEILSPEEAEERRKDKSQPLRRRTNAEVQVEEPRRRARPHIPAEDRGRTHVPTEDAVAVPAEQAIAAVAQPPTDGLPPWTKHDLGFALQQLRSIREGVVRRTLRKLHIRWYHAGSRKMQVLLEAAGVNPQILAMIPSIIDTCDICRHWQRPGPKSVASTRLAETFNKEVQMDLLFYKTHVVLHCIDSCTRWTSVSLLPNREPSSIIDGFANCWVRLFGPPTCILSDQEGGLITDLVGDWMDRRGIQVNFRARGQHCGLVERHNEILRRQLHLLEDQSTAEGFAVSFATVLAEAVFAKNAMFQLGNATPYEAIFGRHPPLMATVSEETGEGVSDRDAYTIRRLAISSMIQATADTKTRIAEASKTRRSGELLDLKLGDLVEFYRKPMNKDTVGWHGPAEVVNLTSLQDGLLHVKWQGRIIAVRVQDVRTAMIYLTFLMRPSGPIRTFKAEVESQTSGAVRLGWMRQGQNWIECQANKTYPNLLAAGLYLSAVCMNLQGVIGFRCGVNVHNLPAIAFDDTLLLWWNMQKPGMSEWYHCFLPGNQVINIPRITNDPDAAIVQFMMVDMTEVLSLRQAVPDIPHLGGSHEPDMPDMHDRTDEVLRAKGPKPLKDVSQPNTNTESENLLKDENVPTSNEAAGSMFADVDDESYNFNYQSVVSDISFLGTFHDVMPDCPSHVACGEFSSFVSAEELTEPPNLLLSSNMLAYVTFPMCQRPKLDSNEWLCLSFAAGADTTAVIERTNNILDRDEALRNVDLCREAMILELMRWVKHGAWKRGKLSEASNVLKSKWVLKWKDIQDGQSKSRKIKARLVAQGFSDRQTTDTYAGTSTRWGQKLLITIAVQRKWALWSADISEAFLRGLTFRELHEEGGELREVQISLPPGGEHLLRTIQGYSDFDPSDEVLVMLKPGFGLKDAPRLWLKALKSPNQNRSLLGFKGEGDDHLAVRSGLVCLVNKDFPKLGPNEIQVVEFVSKKQSRVCRSTYAAEMYNALDLSGLLFNISLTLCEVLEGTCSADSLAKRFEEGKLSLESDLVIDAAAVYDHVSHDEARIPHDSTMTIHGLKLRELLQTGKLQRMIWCDTRCMLADGLNKGLALQMYSQMSARGDGMKPGETSLDSVISQGSTPTWLVRRRRVRKDALVPASCVSERSSDLAPSFGQVPSARFAAIKSPR